MKPRYVQQIVREGIKKWRYNPPPDAVNAGIVDRIYLSPRKETAFNEAERLNKKIDEWRSSVQIATHNDTVEGVIDSYKNSLDYERLSRVSKNAYSYQLNVICNMQVEKKKILGNYKVDKITTPMAQKIYESLCTHGVPFANRIIAVIRKVYSYGIKFGNVSKNPWKDMQLYAEHHRKEVWPKHEITKLLSYCYSDFSTRSIGLIAHMAYEWAQRVGDMRELTWDSINLRDGVLTLIQSKRRAQVKIPIQEDLLTILRQQHDDFGWQKYVAPNVNAKTINGFNCYSVYSLSHASRRCIERAEVDATLRLSDLRRTATTEMVEAGVGMAQIMSVTGHANPQSVKPYMKNTLTSATKACTLRTAPPQEVPTTAR